MSGGEKYGDARADSVREKLAINRALREAALEQEQVDSVAVSSSDPPKARFALRVLGAIQPPWLRAVVVLAAIGSVTYLLVQGVKLWP